MAMEETNEKAPKNGATFPSFPTLRISSGSHVTYFPGFSCFSGQDRVVASLANPFTGCPCVGNPHDS